MSYSLSHTRTCILRYHDRCVILYYSTYEVWLTCYESSLVNQKVLSAQLRRLGYVVHVANNGQQALDFLRTTNLWCQGNKREDEGGEGTDVSLVLLDVEM